MNVVIFVSNLIVVLHVPSCLGFNVATNYSTFLSGPFQTESFFGYSVLLTQNVAFVGAPKYQKSGAVFRCQLSNLAANVSCQKWIHESSGGSDLLGVVLAQRQESLFTCAPRQGICYSSKLSTKQTDPIYNLAAFSIASDNKSVAFGIPIISGGEVLFEFPLSRYIRKSGLDMFGTSVSFGHFSSMTTSDIAVGAPNERDFKGLVVIIGSLYYDYKQYIEGDEFGAKFGYSVCGVDINGDGWDELLIGAPLGSDDTKVYEAGSVVVYDTKLKKQIHKLTKPGVPRSGSRFGAAIINLGDLDGDSFKDFAIGAPFDGFDQEGAIFIYRGNDDMGFKEEPQIIRPQDLKSSTMRGFGYSFYAGNVDLDSNGHPEFIVGAPFSGEAVILYTRKTFFMEPKVEIQKPPKPINPSSAQFKVYVTVAEGLDKVRFATHERIEDLIVEIRFPELDSRIRRLDPIIIELSKNEINTTIPVTFNPRESNFGIGDLEIVAQPLEIMMEFRFSLKNQNCPSVGCTVVDPRSQTNLKEAISIDFNAGCENIDRCDCQLDISDNDEFENEILVLPEFAIKLPTLTLINRGQEVAFNTIVDIIAPFKIHSVTDRQCEIIQDVQVSCQLSAILPGHEKLFALDLNVKSQSVVNVTQDSGIRVDVLQNCASVLSKTFRYQPEFRFNYTIKSKMPKDDRIGFLDENIRLDREITLTNYGPSPTDGLSHVEIFVAKSELIRDIKIDQTSSILDVSFQNCREVSSLTSFDSWTIDNLEGNVLSCTSSETCSVFKCGIPANMFSLSGTSVKISAEFDSKLSNQQGLENILHFIHMKLVTPSGIEILSSQLEIVSEKPGLAKSIVQYWPIIFGVSIGLFIIAIFSGAMYKTNGLNKLRIFKDKMDEEEKRYRLATSEVKELY